MCRWISGNFSLRVEFITLERLHDAQKIGASFPQVLPVVIFVRKHYFSIPPNTFIAMHKFEVYSLNHAGRGFTHLDWIGPGNAAPLYLQRGHGFGNFFGRLFRWVRHLLWRGPVLCVARRCVQEARSWHCRERVTESEPQDIVSKHVTESVQNPIGNLRGGGCKRVWGVISATKKRKKAKRAPVLHHSLVIMSDAEVTSVCSSSIS